MLCDHGCVLRIVRSNTSHWGRARLCFSHIQSMESRATLFFFCFFSCMYGFSVRLGSCVNWVFSQSWVQVKTKQGDDEQILQIFSFSNYDAACVQESMESLWVKQIYVFLFWALMLFDSASYVYGERERDDDDEVVVMGGHWCGWWLDMSHVTQKEVPRSLIWSDEKERKNY